MSTELHTLLTLSIWWGATILTFLALTRCETLIALLTPEEDRPANTLHGMRVGEHHSQHEGSVS